MTRPRTITIAAILLFAVSLLDMVSEVQNLTRGTATGPDEAPFFMTVISFTLAVAGLFAAYGLWRNEKWGKVLTTGLMALQILYSVVPLLVAPPAMQAAAAVGIVIYLAILVLVLWRGRKPAPA